MMFGSVQRMDHIAIVCSGPSLNGLSREALKATGAYVIAVNSSVKLVDAHAFFTCDPSDKNRELLRNQIAGVKYYAAVPADYGEPHAKPYHRDPPEVNVTFLRRLKGDGPWSHRPGFSEERDAINTGNSAYGAANLAYHIGPRRIAFFGMDGGGGYADGLEGTHGDLSHLSQIFGTALRFFDKKRIQVLNASPNSLVTCFRRCSIEDGIKWIS